jgi:hypothetical protein
MLAETPIVHMCKDFEIMCLKVFLNPYETILNFYRFHLDTNNFLNAPQFHLVQC